MLRAFVDETEKMLNDHLHMLFTPSWIRSNVDIGRAILGYVDESSQGALPRYTSDKTHQQLLVNPSSTTKPTSYFKQLWFEVLEQGTQHS